MRVGAITHEGYTIHFNLGGARDGVAISGRFTEAEAESMVAGLLLVLAQLNPLIWQRTFDEVRDIRRARAPATTCSDG